MLRKGAYAVIFKGNHAALIRANGDQYFLPGRGIECGETNEQCLKRELLEETGCTIDEIRYLGYAQRYFLSTLPVARPMVGDGYFYTARLGEQVQQPTEHDNFLEWIDVLACDQLLFHEHQAWAVQEAWAQLQHRP
ncbi:NUDIX domain-containing protein [Sporolactobacillus shoreicorticis]|uniref:NUDIX domain-containing protein n=1 Tax=Sporolactobacillus shoreicorticis TaxID=1923877 RepID=A0ABW5S125_9BACL|nr:NUDIX domain-containing protein [Sporolactobacillus shoreicorticis]MCO7124531.1 NUDIX domain-containing protein [Sporolactobacillus shoreicorticis]